MRRYETVMIINSDITEEEREETISKIRNLIDANGEIESEEAYGIRKLAYEIKKYNEGYYYIIRFESEPSFIRELERVYRITDAILKFNVVLLDE